MARLLVLDDSLSVRKAIERILAPLGHTLELVATAEAAMTALAAEPFDLLVCDLILPESDGFEVCRFATALDAEVPVLAISGVADDASRSRARAAGALELLPKPFSTEDLVAAVERGLGPGAAADLEAGGRHGAAVSRRIEDLRSRLERAAELDGLLFVEVVSGDGEPIAHARGVDSRLRLSEDRRQELLQLGRRMLGEIRGGAFHHLVLEASDALLVLDLLRGGEAFILAVHGDVMLGLARLYAHRIFGREGLARE